MPHKRVDQVCTLCSSFFTTCEKSSWMFWDLLGLDGAQWFLCARGGRGVQGQCKRFWSCTLIFRSFGSPCGVSINTHEHAYPTTNNQSNQPSSQATKITQIFFLKKQNNQTTQAVFPQECLFRVTSERSIWLWTSWMSRACRVPPVGGG